jgi:hypothetical protein
MADVSISSLIDLDVPFSPIPFRSGGQTHLVYELFVHNSAPYVMELTRLEVLPGGHETHSSQPEDMTKNSNATPPFVSYSGKELSENTIYLSETLRKAKLQSLESCTLACIYVWISLERGMPIPQKLHHRLHFRSLLGKSSHREEIVEGAHSAVLPPVAYALLPPVKGSNWLALHGPSNTSEHRRALIPYARNPYFPQRFAIDWVRIGKDGKLFALDSSQNKNWHGYGSEVIAAADAMIIDARDGTPDNEPLAKPSQPSLTLQNAAGNFLVLDMGDHNYAVYAHLQPGSLQVKVGEQVPRGKGIALIGNSGSSEYPHLHFHVGSTPAPLISQGLPYILESFERSGVGKIPSRREMELPLENMMVNF